MTPRFSVVVPTRDRLALLDFCLESLAMQTYSDFEVIVADNPVERSALSVFERWERRGWQYLRAAGPLAMHDNFERACAAARGEYVAVLIDKTLLHPTALEVTDRALTIEPQADIVTWWNEAYVPSKEQRHRGRGQWVPTSVTTAKPSLYDPSIELAKVFANASRRGTDPVHYCRGKIVFGAYSRSLLELIRERVGRVFHPLSPDYTSRIPALVLGGRALDVGRPLLLSYHSVDSNGRRAAASATYMRQFIERAEPAAMGALPIPGLYSSHHNVVAYDLVTSAARCPAGSSMPELDLANLLRRAREDLDFIAWDDPAQQNEQYAILEAAEARLGVVPPTPLPYEPPPPPTRKRLALDGLARVPPVERFVFWAAGRPIPKPLLFDSPVEAARAADRHYSAGAAACANRRPVQ
jgi:hypothetical protein